jgi:prepilin-type N-terminal cleavage/methylation domain-containing protein
MDVHHLRDHNGFSLLEILIAASILGILTAMAVPSFSLWIARQQLRQATTELASNYTMARTAAMSRGTGVTVTTGMTGGKATLTFGGNVFKPVTLNERVTNITATTVAFNPFGLRSGGGATNTLIVVTPSQGQAYSVAVSPTGRVFWCATTSCP